MKYLLISSFYAALVILFTPNLKASSSTRIKKVEYKSFGFWHNLGPEQSMCPSSDSVYKYEVSFQGDSKPVEIYIHPEGAVCGSPFMIKSGNYCHEIYFRDNRLVCEFGSGERVLTKNSFYEMDADAVASLSDKQYLSRYGLERLSSCTVKENNIPTLIQAKETVERLARVSMDAHIYYAQNKLPLLEKKFPDCDFYGGFDKLDRLSKFQMEKLLRRFR